MRKNTTMFLLCTCATFACLSGLAQAQDSIYLEISPCDLCVQPCEEVQVAVKVRNLTQRINLIDATIGYPGLDCEGNPVEALFCATDVRAGAPLWTDVRISPCDLTSTRFIMGLLPPEFKAIGTVADGTVATITLTACDEEGVGTIGLSSASASVVDICGDPCPPTTELPLNTGEPVTIMVDGTPPDVNIEFIQHENCSGPFSLVCCPCTDCPQVDGNPCCPPAAPDYGCCLPGTCYDLSCAGPGTVVIQVTASDNCDKALRKPSVQVITACGVEEDITWTGQPVDGTRAWKYRFEVTEETAPGPAVVLAMATDCAGNVSTIADATFKICPILRISGLIELEDFAGSIREVQFTVCKTDGTTVQSVQALKFNRMEDFCHAVALYELAIPGARVGNIQAVCVKTSWNLSRGYAITSTDYCCGHLVVDFVGDNWLPSGDVNTGNPTPLPLGDDLISAGDLSVVENAIGSAMNFYNYWADVNGDGALTESDMDIVLRNFDLAGAADCYLCQPQP